MENITCIIFFNNFPVVLFTIFKCLLPKKILINNFFYLETDSYLFNSIVGHWRYQLGGSESAIN